MGAAPKPMILTLGVALLLGADQVDKKQKEFWSYGKKLYIEMAHRYIAPGAFRRID
jgi:hypothetical protein